jgi:hypothetical protein
MLSSGSTTSSITIWLAFELVYIYFFAVEVRGRSLEEMAALIDVDEAVRELEARARADMAEEGHLVGDEKLPGSGSEDQVELYRPNELRKQ